MEKNKADLVAVQPVLREFTPAFGYKKYGVPYHPGALKYFKDRNLEPRRGLGAQGAGRGAAGDRLRGGYAMSAMRN